jgi:hypothetical protein
VGPERRIDAAESEQALVRSLLDDTAISRSPPE